MLKIENNWLKVPKYVLIVDDSQGTVLNKNYLYQNIIIYIITYKYIKYNRILLYTNNNYI